MELVSSNARVARSGFLSLRDIRHPRLEMERHNDEISQRFELKSSFNAGGQPVACHRDQAPFTFTPK